MIRAIYIAREDGDYDFVAAFAEVPKPRSRFVDADFYAHRVRGDGEEYILKNFKDLAHLTDVIESWEAKFEKKL